MKRPFVVTRALSALLAALALSTAAQAATNAPWRQSASIQVNVNEQALPSLLRTLTAESGIPLNISEAVKGSVSGRFKGAPQRIFDELVSNHGLVQFYDGHVLHINTLAESGSRSIPVSAQRFARLKAMLLQVGVDDKTHALRWFAPENHVLVAGPPRLLSLVEELANMVERGPAAGGPAELRVFRLKQSWAKDVTFSYGGKSLEIPGVATLLRRTLGAERLGMASHREPAPRQNAGSPGGTSSASNGLNGGGTSTKSSEGLNALPAMTPRIDAQGGSLMMPQGRPSSHEADLPSIEADPANNVIIVRDLAARWPMYEALIQELDTPKQLLEISATVIDVDADQSERFGVNWRLLNQGHVDIGGGRAGALNANADARANLADDTSASGLVSSVVLGNQSKHFAATLNAMVGEGQAHVSAKPRVLTLNNHEAVLENRQNFYVRVAGRDAANLFELSAGLRMRVTPQLIGDPGAEQVKLLINIEDGNVNQERVDQLPVVTHKSLNTQAVIGLGDSLFIGGYVLEQTVNSSSHVPGLGKLPLLGPLFRQKAEQARRVERMFLITPRLIDSAASRRNANASLDGGRLQGAPL